MKASKRNRNYPLAWGAAPADDFARFPHFRFSDEAQAVFIEWSGDMHRARIPNEDEPIIRQHMAKFDKLFPALALVFHLVDCAAHGVCGPVSKEAALRTAAWCEYLEAHARRCYGLLKDDGPRAAQARWNAGRWKTASRCATCAVINAAA